MEYLNTYPIPSDNDTIQPAAAKNCCFQDRPDPPLGCNRWLLTCPHESHQILS